MQQFKLLKNERVEQIHASSIRILTQIGVEFGYPPALEMLKKGGARVEGQRVFFSERLIEEQIDKAPGKFRLYARNPEKDVIVGGENTVFTPGYGAPFVTELNSGRRKGTLKDFVNFVKLTGASTNQDICSGTVIEANDVPHEIRHAKMIYAAMKYSEKPFM